MRRLTHKRFSTFLVLGTLLAATIAIAAPQSTYWGGSIGLALSTLVSSTPWISAAVAVYAAWCASTALIDAQSLGVPARRTLPLATASVSFVLGFYLLGLLAAGFLAGFMGGQRAGWHIPAGDVFAPAGYTILAGLLGFCCGIGLFRFVSRSRLLAATAATFLAGVVAVGSFSTLAWLDEPDFSIPEDCETISGVEFCSSASNAHYRPAVAASLQPLLPQMHGMRVDVRDVASENNPHPTISLSQQRSLLAPTQLADPRRSLYEFGKTAWQAHCNLGEDAEIAGSALFLDADAAWFELYDTCDVAGMSKKVP